MQMFIETSTIVMFEHGNETWSTDGDPNAGGITGRMMFVYVSNDEDTVAWTPLTWCAV